MSDNELIWIEHPALGPDRRQEVTLKQLKTVWRFSGWFLTDAPEPEEVDYTIPLGAEAPEPEPAPEPKPAAPKKPAAAKKKA